MRARATFCRPGSPDEVAGWPALLGSLPPNQRESRRASACKDGEVCSLAQAPASLYGGGRPGMTPPPELISLLSRRREEEGSSGWQGSPPRP